MKGIVVLLLISGLAQAETSPAGPASALPLPVPGFEAPPAPRMDFKPETPATSECAVSTSQLPPEFMRLMSRLEEPVASTETGLPPVVEQIAPAVAQQQQRRQRRSHGIEVLNGGGEVRLGRSRENGVTVYRGLEPDQH